MNTTEHRERDRERIEVLKQLEPAASAISTDTFSEKALVSVAISLRRIADALHWTNSGGDKINIAEVLEASLTDIDATIGTLEK